MLVCRNDQFGLPIIAPQGAVDLNALTSTIHSAVLEGHKYVALDLSWVEQMTVEHAKVLSDVSDWASREGARVALIGISPAAFRALNSARKPVRSLFVPKASTFGPICA